MSNPEEETIEILYNQGMGMKFCLSEEAYERFVELKVQNDDPEYKPDKHYIPKSKYNRYYRQLENVPRHDKILLQVYREFGKNFEQKSDPICNRGDDCLWCQNIIVETISAKFKDYYYVRYDAENGGEQVELNDSDYRRNNLDKIIDKIRDITMDIMSDTEKISYIKNLIN
jgi:hypothetical protein